MSATPQRRRRREQERRLKVGRTAASDGREKSYKKSSEVQASIFYSQQLMLSGCFDNNLMEKQPKHPTQH